MSPSCFRTARSLWPAASWLLVVLWAWPAGAEGWLDLIRSDVRSAPPQSEPERSPRRRHHGDHDEPSFYGEFYGDFLMFAFTSPFWGPHAALDDDFDNQLLFPRFPYDNTLGYMDVAPWASRPRRWSVRLRADYGDAFGGLQRVGGHLLLSTAARWGLDTEMTHLWERLPGGERDELWLGDFNVCYRFAQSERMQWRTGIGFNWLDDPAATDYGFNFTYGVDCFPKQPWVLSATLDWGTLGRAEQFRFRSSAGVLIRGAETYIGYEYLDIDRTQINSLLAGVRVWF